MSEPGQSNAALVLRPGAKQHIRINLRGVSSNVTSQNGSRTERDRAELEQNRTEQNRAERNRTEQSRTEQNGTELEQNERAQGPKIGPRTVACNWAQNRGP